MDGQTNQPATQPISQGNPNTEPEFNFAPEDFADLDSVSGKQTAEPQSSAPTSKIKIKYNGVEEEYDPATQQDTIVELLQKGRNYDKVNADKEALANSEEIQFLREQAKEAGFKDTKEYLQKLRADLQQDAITKRAQQLEAEGYNPQHALYTAQLESKAKQGTPRQVDPNEAFVQEMSNKFGELLAEYPETKQFKTLNDYPKPVIDMIQQGKTPLVAYQKYLLDTERSKAEIEAQNQANAKRDIGSLQSGKDDKAEDPFIAGLFGR